MNQGMRKGPRAIDRPGDAAGPSAAPDCAAPPAVPLAPRERLPALACDTHLHVFGDPRIYPLSPARGYTPHPCSLVQYQALMRALGVERAVLVQPSVYGTDNSALLDALKEGGPAFRGVVVPPADIDDAGLQRMHDAGVRGFRRPHSAGDRSLWARACAGSAARAHLPARTRPLLDQVVGALPAAPGPHASRHTRGPGAHPRRRQPHAPVVGQ
jgi:hypothetical protein